MQWPAFSGSRKCRRRRLRSLVPAVILAFGFHRTFVAFQPRWAAGSFAGRSSELPHGARSPGRLGRAAVFTVLAEEVGKQPGLFFGEVAAVVLLSTAFEAGEKWLRQRLRASGDTIGREILDALFREITILGFIGLLLFLITHTLPPQNDVLITFGEGEGEPFSETFEYVHMATFLLLVVLLFQGFAVLQLSRETTRTWSYYESARAFGMAPSSIESMLADEGYIARQANPQAPRGMDLTLQKPFTYGTSVVERWLLRQKYVHKLVMWRAVRHGFLFDGEQSRLLAAEGNINPGLFSFRAFMEYQLGQIVLALVEVDVLTWAVALVLVAAVTALCNALQASAVLVQCLSCWALFLVAIAFCVILEEDTFELTPQVPADARQILRLLSGTASQMLRRSSWVAPSLQSVEADSADSMSISGRRYHPGLPGLEQRPRPTIQEPPRPAGGKDDKRYLLVQEYMSVFRLLTFLQAAAVTSLIIEYFSGSIEGWSEAVPYALAWIEWPLMLFLAVPALVRRLTVRAAVTRTRTNNWYRDKQRSLVKKVMVSGTEGLLRDCTRIVHLQGFEARAVLSSAEWAQPPSVRRALSAKKEDAEKRALRVRAAAAVDRGTRLFESLPPALKTEIFNIFAAWDVQNDGAVAPRELAQSMELMGFTATAERAAENLIRLVDDDGTGLLTWRKCRALILLATADRPMDERRRDLETFFSRVQKKSPRSATVFELAQALPVASITPGDLASLVYRHFGQVKPALTRGEFVEWVEAIEFSTTAFE